MREQNTHTKIHCKHILIYVVEFKSNGQEQQSINHAGRRVGELADVIQFMRVGHPFTTSCFTMPIGQTAIVIVVGDKIQPGWEQIPNILPKYIHAGRHGQTFACNHIN